MIVFLYILFDDSFIKTDDRTIFKAIFQVALRLLVFGKYHDTACLIIKAMNKIDIFSFSLCIAFQVREEILISCFDVFCRNRKDISFFVDRKDILVFI